MTRFRALVLAVVAAVLALIAGSVVYSGATPFMAVAPEAPHNCHGVGSSIPGGYQIDDLTCVDGTTPTTVAPPTTTTVAPTTTTTVAPTTTTVAPTTTTVAPTTTTVPGAAACGLASAAFCDTFDAAASSANQTPRGGDLDKVWGVSITGADTNTGQGQLAAWNSTELELCGSTVTVARGGDVRICGGQLREALDDAGGVRTLAMYPKQPFDWAGRTGKVVFDVRNDSFGSHGAWPEFWITDKPVPAPFTHLTSLDANPRAGFGLRLAGCSDASGNAATCGSASGGTGIRTGLESVDIERPDYINNDSQTGVGTTGLVGSGQGVPIAAPHSAEMNHYEIQVSETVIRVYATNPFTGAWNPTTHPLVLLGTINNPNLGITRGLVWIEDSHYNGEVLKTHGPEQQNTHTFVWDNVGFDGPKTYRDFSYDVPMPTQNPASEVNNTGWYVGPGQDKALTVTGVDMGTATSAQVVFQWYTWDAVVPSISVNGNAYITTAWPFDSTTGTDKTISVAVPLAQLHAGTNTVTFRRTQSGASVVHDVNVVLVAAGAVP